MLIFDIGANIGNYTNTYNKDNNIIVSVEASPHTYNQLKDRFKHFNNITCLNYAICDENTDYVTFYDMNGVLSTLDRNWLSSPESRFYGNIVNAKEIKVKPLSLDKLIDLYGIPDMCKIDVEGAEEKVINSLHHKIPIILFEWASEWKDSIIKCINMLDNLGYTRYHIQREDKYDYHPGSFELNKEECINIINKSILKVDWGMIWAN